MSDSLRQLFLERITQGLQRKSITTPSKWACKYRVLGTPYPGPWTFKYHPWLREMHDSNSEINIGQKAAQMGYTEWALNIAFYYIDIKQVDVLYVLPAKTPDASDFSAARFDPALELSPHLSKLFSDVKNVGHKRAGSCNLYLRGSKSRSGLKSIPTGVIILDELDEMEQDNIGLATERAAGQLERKILMLSTPTIDDHGINKEFKLSTQEYFFFRCPHCSRFIDLTFPESVVITADHLLDPAISNSHYICKYCKVKLDNNQKIEWYNTSQWVPAVTSNVERRGFSINQMYSCSLSGNPINLATNYLKSLTNPADEQNFYNSSLGKTFVSQDAKLKLTEIEANIKSYSNLIKPKSNTLVTMGIDVGKYLHFVIKEWYLGNQNILSFDINLAAYSKTLVIHKVLNFEDLDSYISDYGPQSIVIDAHPERRKAYELATRFWGLVKLCYYARDINGKSVHHWAPEESSINVDRTSWLDVTIGRVRKGNTSFPIDSPWEFKQHLMNVIRIYEKDPQGNPVAKYLTPSGEDHYVHALNYAEIALAIANIPSNKLVI